ncbi:uncharacterized protein LOC108681886 isoform X2 [Hyalella azteca]|uniref:Metalloendopeptidase n=1 Tax=Hyalella azteca TaxID=294128 RepID=A0A8B7PM35_HYAAZ|nr:uncharacterized protein LOC108681886 isoform X2 [Hyalella azteca]
MPSDQKDLPSQKRPAMKLLSFTLACLVAFLTRGVPTLTWKLPTLTRGLAAPKKRMPTLVWRMVALVVTLLPSTAAQLGRNVRAGDVVYNVPFIAWPGAVVPYVFASTFSSEDVAAMQRNMAAISDVSCVRFVRRTNETSYLDLLTSYDQVGEGSPTWQYNPAGRSILITPPPSIQSRGLAALMLTLGFGIEHTRGDRDEFIRLDCSRCSPTFRDRLKPRMRTTTDLQFPYDSVSVTHIGTLEVGRINATLEAVDPSTTTFNAEQDALSKIDIQKLNHFYNCSSAQEVSSSNITTSTTSISTSSTSTSEPIGESGFPAPALQDAGDAAARGGSENVGGIARSGASDVGGSDISGNETMLSENAAGTWNGAAFTEFVSASDYGDPEAHNLSMLLLSPTTSAAGKLHVVSSAQFVMMLTSAILCFSSSFALSLVQ